MNLYHFARLLIQVLCSYVTLPLYALVTQVCLIRFIMNLKISTKTDVSDIYILQMGSKMKHTIFNERVATALRKWHQTARKHLKENNKKSGSITPFSTSRATTPTNSLPHVYRFQHLPSDLSSQRDHSSRTYNIERYHFDVEDQSIDQSPVKSPVRATTTRNPSSPTHLLRECPSDLSSQQYSQGTAGATIHHVNVEIQNKP
ncbi:hypothetical protein Cni_G08738 [Canna indica]|uniref:Uncharacterized protein n=1 Tax=Canna indica TaxID=4628 RepID=A0AAQ3K0Z8_9LILI|nr:hypothetical protein Cni_G08738 [Canna indica]